MPWNSMIGKNLYEVMPQELARQRMEYIKQALETGQIQVYEYQITLNDQLCYEEARIVVSGEDEVLAIIRDITDRKHTEAALRQAKEKYRSIFENAVEGIFQVTLDGRYISANPALARIYGYTSSEELLASLTDANQHYVHPERYVEFIQLMQQNKKIERFESQIYRQDGSIIWISQNARPIVNADCIGYYEGFVEDITERKQAEVALRQSEQRFRAIFENVAIGIGLTDSEGQHIEVNPAWQKILGYSNEELRQMSFTEFTYPDDVAADVELYKELLAGRRDHYQMEKRYICKSGQLAWGRLTVSLIRDRSNETQLAIATIENITERKRVEDKLQHNALHDVLTNLPNRALFVQRLEAALELTQRSAKGSSLASLSQAQRQAGYLFAVLFLDLDRFKNINDSLGHLVGDRLLIAIAQKLTASLRPGDTVARLGGDEFAILLEDIKSVSDATWIAERIQKQLSSPLNLDGHEVFTTVSIGIALSTHGYGNAEEILRDADTAMYRAKGLGKARYEIFNKAMHERVFTVLQLENDLRRALDYQEFQLHYQPIVSLETGRITGFEALVRWQHPQRGMISPAEFIPVAEETGLILPLGDWVLRTACRQMHQWQRQSPAMPLTINVNISSRQFLQPTLVEQIDQILQETELEPHNLKLELTESGLMDNAESAATMLYKLQAMNIQLCIDDFGTGYSSLSYLHQFPINILKIDRSFINRIGVAGENAEIVRTIVTLANNLNMDVVAEGVETTAQVIHLKALGCKYAQGYFFSQPLDEQVAEALVTSSLIDLSANSICLLLS
jgi:diguanylate cyclase (GGDEF)-like protein/PAS domain S-box-containing protein